MLLAPELAALPAAGGQGRAAHLLYVIFIAFCGVTLKPWSPVIATLACSGGRGQGRGARVGEEGRLRPLLRCSGAGPRALATACTQAEC